MLANKKLLVKKELSYHEPIVISQSFFLSLLNFIKGLGPKRNEAQQTTQT